MKHRSVSKVRSAKVAKKIRFVAKQEANAKRINKNPIKQVWVSTVYIAAHTDAQTKTQIPARIMMANGTYCRAKHDIRTTDRNGFPTTKRYVAN